MTSAPPADPTVFRRLMGRWPTGVSVVTSRDGERDFGLTVNAFLSVSIAPPSVLVSLGHEADSTAVVARTGRFAVNLLGHEQRSHSERFARIATPEAKFQGVAIHRTPSGLAALDGAVAIFDTKVVKSLDTGDHTLFVGTVERMETGPETVPLLFVRGQYAESAGPDLLRLPKPRV
ncbi:MAG: flavin reductase family protein [Thermoplasmata archaeon]|nr:flavin reductase family protein [Thermoplasmata archaeon]